MWFGRVLSMATLAGKRVPVLRRLHTVTTVDEGGGKALTPHAYTRNGTHFVDDVSDASSAGIRANAFSFV